MIIQITGTDQQTRRFEFTNDLDFELVENLNKGDRILFEYQQAVKLAEIKLDVSIQKRFH